MKLTVKIISETPPWEWPDRAGEVLMSALQDRQAATADRALAAELAGNLVVMNDQVAESLLKVLEDGGEAAELRGTAAIALGPTLEQTDIDGFDDDVLEPPVSQMMFRRIQATLRRIYDDADAPKVVRRRALEASVRATEDWHNDAIRDALSWHDEDWTLTAVFCMRWVKGFNPKILKMLESPNPEIQREAILAAGNWEVKAAWPHVRALLGSERTEKSVLLAAIEAAPGLDPEEAESILYDLTESVDEEIADAAREALLMAGEGDDEDFDKDEGSSPYF